MVYVIRPRPCVLEGRLTRSEGEVLPNKKHTDYHPQSARLWTQLQAPVTSAETHSIASNK